jgi:hypothetical protein
VRERLPLSAARLRVATYRGLPWSDVYEPGEEDDAIRAAVIVSASGSSLDGSFDLLDRLPGSDQPVDRTNEKALERIAVARFLFGEEG